MDEPVRDDVPRPVGEDDVDGVGVGEATAPFDPDGGEPLGIGPPDGMGPEGIEPEGGVPPDGGLMPEGGPPAIALSGCSDGCTVLSGGIVLLFISSTAAGAGMPAGSMAETLWLRFAAGTTSASWDVAEAIVDWPK